MWFVFTFLFLILFAVNILGIETSCDETSAAVITDGVLKSNVISSQIVHRQYGGIVPELASRAHQQLIIPIVQEALNIAGITKQQLNGIAVTYGPGLIGSLLVGLNFAKAMAFGLKIPFIGINHMEAHIYANFIEDPKPDYPFLCLIVSGGHTQIVLVEAPLKHLLLGETLDDAAGEAFDKVGKMLGLGFPGGPIIDRLAQKGNPDFVKFPRSYLDEDNFEFSFSGIKTSVLYWLRNHNVNLRDKQTIPSPGDENYELITNLCASFQAAVVDVLVGKILRASKKYSIRDITVAGGVSANSELRRQLVAQGTASGYRVFFPKFDYCTDNGAMIAQLGAMKFRAGESSPYTLTAVPYLEL